MSIKPSVVFFGTHDFAASILEALFQSGEYEIKAVVTQPDRPVGRHQKVVKSPVKLVAERHRTVIHQPESLQQESKIINLKSKIFIVCQYGLIIPKAVIDTPETGTINVHTSLLPKYRGASPIQSALIKGESETGVTIMQMDEKLDHGPILSQIKIDIDADDTYPMLSKKMEPIAARLLLDTLPKWLEKKIQPQIQNETEATFCKQLNRDDGKIDWKKSADDIYNLYRGLTPWPGIWTTWNGKRLKLKQIKKATVKENYANSVGKVTISDSKIFVECEKGAIEILELQLEGKKVMAAKPFLTGYRDDLKNIVLG